MPFTHSASRNEARRNLSVGVYHNLSTRRQSQGRAENAVVLRKELHATSVERAFAILEFLDGSRRGWNISELSRKLHIPKSTTHVIVLTLQRLGYLTLDPLTRDYSLGLKVSGLGRGLMKSLSLPDRALRPMQWLVEVTRCTAQLAVLADDQAMYIQKVEGPGLIQFDSYIGKRTNLHCTGVGKVLLAYAPEQRQEHILNRKSFAHYTNKTITSPNQLRKEMTKVRQRGYAIDDEEEELEVRCVAVPVFSKSGDFMAALAIAGTVGQIREENIDDLARYAIQAASKIFRCPEESTGSNTASG
jgi:DNA-binding IclR family transcriptional regulator